MGDIKIETRLLTRMQFAIKHHYQVMEYFLRGLSCRTQGAVVCSAKMYYIVQSYSLPLAAKANPLAECFDGVLRGVWHHPPCFNAAGKIPECLVYVRLQEYTVFHTVYGPYNTSNRIIASE